MATLLNGINGSFSGKVGDLVGSSRRGIHSQPATGNTQPATHSKLIAIFLIPLILGACRTDKFLNTEKTRSSDLSATNIRIEELKHETYRASQMISLNDSNDHYYRINIFPVDSFSFSVQHGFRGRASRMEIVSSARQVTRLAEKRDLLAAKQDYSTKSQVNKSRRVRGTNSKVLEKSKRGGEWALIWLGLAGLIVFTGWKILKK